MCMEHHLEFESAYKSKLYIDIEAINVINQSQCLLQASKQSVVLHNYLKVMHK